METSKEKISNYVVVSKIPAPIGRFKRSVSLRVRGEKANILTTPGTPFPSILEKDESPNKDQNRGKLSYNLNRSRSHASMLNREREDDLDSLDSFVSHTSAISSKSNCEHAHFAKNGTTYSGRLHRYIVHCQTAYNDSEEYLTPTQRTNRTIKRLKTLLQLAREKLREKEEEVFKLTKEVVELRVFKASVNSQFSEGSSPSDPKDIPSGKQEKSVINCDVDVQTMPYRDDLQKLKDFPCDAYNNEFSPIKNSFYFEENNEELLKMSPVSPQHCFVEKMSATPDFLLSSLADSGNFDDMASSVSLHSKDSVGFTITPDLRPSSVDKPLDEHDSREMKEPEEEKLRFLNSYENKLKEKKIEYEIELKRIVDEQEQKNIKMMQEFENKLKEEERKFEERWTKLLKTSEEEKQMIVERFERKLTEEKEKYLKELLKTRGSKISDPSSEAYITSLEREKSLYESSLQSIISKFEKEKSLIENTFDGVMENERKKFEQSLSTIERMNDSRINELLSTISGLEKRYYELIPKYEEALNKNKELEAENKGLKEALDEQEERHKNVYLKLYMKGQEAAKLEHEHKIAECVEKGASKVPVPELLVQLKVTEAELENLKDKEYRALHTDPQGVCLLSSKEAISLWMLAARKAMYKRLAEVQGKSVPRSPRDDNNAEATLQFLKSAVYYFLTDRENQLGHLRAIESILGFNAVEKGNIEKNYSW